ncbi:sigma-70 family RNA polymerase sigma factor [Amycolatopsis sp. La24]|uniref:sigma-70 family RNA polymerase sigma factor n=1 Tax=Amycolatopsis sp. La24 TaxID=3028304 RepID=UPI0023B005CD|nr:sigma-70 family RNA polymerase sigma factor [Amycolatopsis sp. La24]
MRSADRRDDGRLVDAVRRGDVAAYGDLYARHVDAARALARKLSRTKTEADDLVSEAFIRVLQELRAGRGPDSAVRAYLLTVLRNVAYNRSWAERRVAPTEDVTRDADPIWLSVPFHDTAAASVDKSLAAKAFAGLPARWRDILWLTAIAKQTPSQAAACLGLTPNGVSALAYRAREGLRQGYLQAHVPDAPAQRCAPALSVLGAWIRNDLSKRQARTVEEHLRACEPCLALSAELAEINSSFRAVKASARPSGRSWTR